MFIGHFGAGLAAKSISPKPSLGTLIFAAQFIDLIWPLFLLFGIERVEIDPGNTKMTPLNFVHYPFSHSLLFVLIWAFTFGLVYYLVRRNFRVSILLGALVVSHWILDLFTHRPDLPLTPWSNTMVGLGLWNSFFGTVVIEGLIFVAGAYLYLTVTKSKNRTGLYALWLFLVFLVITYVANLFGSPPPSPKSIAVVALSQWLLVLWGYWIDRNRESVSQLPL